MSSWFKFDGEIVVRVLVPYAKTCCNNIVKFMMGIKKQIHRIWTTIDITSEMVTSPRIYLNIVWEDRGVWTAYSGVQPPFSLFFSGYPPPQKKKKKKKNHPPHIWPPPSPFFVKSPLTPHPHAGIIKTLFIWNGYTALWLNPRWEQVLDVR